MSRNQRLGFLGIAAVIAVAAIMVLTAGGGNDEQEATGMPAGETVTESFKASITGIFEIELHGSGEQIGELRVDPR